ncbi:MAG: DKNYY domain-containing protein [Bacteroidales bacterium]
MNTKTRIFILFIMTYSWCYGQTKYFQPTGIVDKTEEYIKNHVGWILLNNNESVDGYTRIGNSIYGGKIGCNVKPLKGIDVKTFKVLAGTNYAKDKNHLFYPQVIDIIEDIDCNASFYSELIVYKANPKYFQYLGNNYGTDDKNVFLKGYIIEKADSKTFKIIKGGNNIYFGVDKQHVYVDGEKVKDADPFTFHYDDKDSRNNEDISIFRDKNKVWEYSRRIGFIREREKQFMTKLDKKATKH